MVKVIKHEGNRDLSNERIGIVINNSDDQGSAEAGINCDRAAYYFGLNIHHIFAGTGAQLNDDARIDFRVDNSLLWNHNSKAKKLEAVVEAAAKGADAVEQILREGKTALSLGGNHVRGLDIIGALRYCHELGIELGLIWVDAHPDLNTPETTPSGNIHGMVSAVLTGKGPQELLELLKGAPFIRPENIIYVGLNSIDDQEGQENTERKYLEELKSMGVKSFEMTDVRNKENPDKMPQKVLDAITELGGRLKQKGGKLWVELDVDVFRKEDMPGAVMDNNDGMLATQGYHLFEHIGKTMTPIGMGVSELSPEKDRDGAGANVVARCVGHTMGVHHPLYDELKKRDPDEVNLFTLDPSREKFTIGDRWRYKRPDCEYVLSDSNYFVLQNGKCIGVVRNSYNNNVSDISLGSRVKVNSHGSSGVGTVTGIMVPYSERFRTDDIVDVRLDGNGHSGQYKVGELTVMEGEEAETK